MKASYNQMMYLKMQFVVSLRGLYWQPHRGQPASRRCDARVSKQLPLNEEWEITDIPIAAEDFAFLNEVGNEAASEIEVAYQKCGLYCD
jgi:hypothetical protein